MHFKVFAALEQDMDQGWVWVSQVDIQARCLVRIKNKRNNRIIYCEARIIDENYLRKYSQANTYHLCKNTPTICISEWYRMSLGISNTGKIHDIDISPEKNLVARFRTLTSHPQLIVRLASWVSIISLILGAISLLLGFDKLCHL